MRPHPPRSGCSRAFTLIELLVVMAIMILLIVVSTLGLRSINTSGQFNKALTEISGILEQGRAYAIAQDTYVWVAIYGHASANNGPAEVYVATFASADGTDPFNWTGVAIMPSPGVYGSTTLTRISRTYHYAGLNLQTNTLPDAPTSSTPNFPASAPVFQFTTPGSSGAVTLPGTGAGATYWVIEFTPTGAAHNSANPIDSIWLGMQPSLSQTVEATNNNASLKVNGLTGLTTVYRQ